MKDATLYCLEETYRLLNSANIGVPIYAVEQFPGDSDKYFVRINSAYYLTSRSKDKYSQEVYINVDTVARLEDNKLSEKKLSELQSKVLEALIPPLNGETYLSNDDFSIYDVDPPSGITFREPYNNGQVIVRQNEIVIKILIK
jgi:hypothetical protein